jgi:hypothetical protein
MVSRSEDPDRLRHTLLRDNLYIDFVALLVGADHDMTGPGA